MESLSDKNNDKHPNWIEVRELDYDGDSEQLFLSLFKEGDKCYWLDSNRALKNEPNRFSFMGGLETDLDKIIFAYSKKKEIKILSKQGEKTHQTNIFDYLRLELEKYAHLKAFESKLPFGFKTGFVGYLGYELKNDFDFYTSHQADIPDAALFFSSRTIVLDHNKNKLYLLALTTKSKEKESTDWFEKMTSIVTMKPQHSEPFIDLIEEEVHFSLSQNHEEYIKSIERCKEKIIDGESYEICLTNRISTQLNLKPLNLYRHLRRNNPAPYAAFLNYGDFSILSSSPEQFLKIKKDGWISTKPIKGTIEKSEDPVKDLENQKYLKYNEKDRAENLMIVDLLRNDLGKVCKIGTVSVPVLMDVESYATLHQLVSTVIGELKPELSVIDCLEATFPGGSITGAPKIRTMEIIDDLESEARSVYTGSIGYISLNHSVELNIAIRTAIVTSEKITIGVGGAITYLSDPEAEFKEIIVKGYPLVKAIVSACKKEYSKKHFRFIR